ncbi:MAG: hypothetical protein ABFS22_12840 [Pseudomonadota bacterium]
MQLFFKTGLLAVFLLLCFPLLTAAGEEPAPDIVSEISGSIGMPWHSLQFGADSLGNSVTTTLELSATALPDLNRKPYSELPDTPQAFGSEQLLRLQVDGQLSTLLGNSTTSATLWFDAGNGQALLRERLRPGNNGSSRIYRFSRTGVSRLRIEPDNSRESGQSVEHWTKRKTKFYKYDMEKHGCTAVSDPSVLFYFVTDTNMARAPHCVFFDDALYRVRLVPDGSQSAPVDYVITTGNSSQHITGERELEKLSLHIEPLRRKTDIAKFELFELRGAIAIYIDPESRLPVQVSGERGGNITLRLSAATLGRVIN